MVRHWWHIAAVVVLSLVQQVSHAQAVAQWSETVHDFGTFHENQGKKSCSFVVENTGDSALVITRVQSTCGCTVAQYTTQSIEPGERGEVNLTFTPTGRPGPFEKDVWVYTNTHSRKNRLTIKGVVVGTPETVSRYFPVNAGDLQLTSLTMATGEVKKGLLRNSTITAYNSGLDTLVITFDNNTSHITPHAVPDTVAPGGISTMSFFFDTMRTPIWGINDDVVTIIATPLSKDGSAKRIDANLVVNVVEDFSHLTPGELAVAPVCNVMTDKIVVGEIASIHPTEALMRFKNSGKSNLVVRRVMALDKTITVTCDKTLLKEGEEATVTLKINPDKMKDKILNTQFNIITNDPVNPNILVRVVGEMR